MKSPHVPGTETGNLYTLFSFITHLCEAGISLLPSFFSPFYKHFLSNYHVSDAGHCLSKKEWVPRAQKNSSKLNEHAPTYLEVLKKPLFWWHLLPLVLGHRGVCIFGAETGQCVTQEKLWQTELRGSWATCQGHRAGSRGLGFEPSSGGTRKRERLGAGWSPNKAGVQ